MSEVHRSKRSSCVKEGVWNPPQSSRVLCLQDNSLTFCVAAYVCVFIMAKSSSTFLDSVVHIESSVHRDKALSPRR